MEVLHILQNAIGPFEEMNLFQVTWTCVPKSKLQPLAKFDLFLRADVSITDIDTQNRRRVVLRFPNKAEEYKGLDASYLPKYVALLGPAQSSKKDSFGRPYLWWNVPPEKTEEVLKINSEAELITLTNGTCKLRHY